jgi:hypothetical protein
MAEYPSQAFDRGPVKEVGDPTSFRIDLVLSSRTPE